MTAVVTWFRNIIRALMLDADFYNEAEVDRSMTVQAVCVVIVATTLSGIGSAIATDASIVLGAIAGGLTGVLGWLLWSWIALVVGTKVFKGLADYGEMIRVIGFAFAPLAIGVVPWLGFVGAAWSLVAATIGIREGMDFDTKRAIGTVAVGWGAWLLLSVLVQVVLDIELLPRLPF
ncbi:MAG: YIP1 family protein [Acidimicrobiia bacterium]